MNLFELFVKVGVDDQASGKLKDLGGKLGNGLKTAAKIGTAAVGAAAAGITALTTAAVNNYAEYEQLVGGVETLFKDSAGKVQEYAANAYKTAGMSANEYMSTVTSFSASLLQSLGGDTDKAAEYANQALTDMSDNANKMGTSMEMIQNAYQGFAKQNYTMLDNLKLGYGGTKTEMERLIADAAKLDSSIQANDLSFGNIVKAINVVQTEMGITGTTALEVGRTISGSVGAMKSAWTNLITGLADGNADIGQLVDNLVTTIVGDGTEGNLGVIGNILPAVKTALSGSAKLVEEIFPEIIGMVPEIIEDTLPQILSSGINVIKSILAGIASNPDEIIDTVFSVIDTLIAGIEELLPDIIVTGALLLGKLAAGIVSAIPDLVLKIPEIISKIVDGFAENSGEFTEIGENIVNGIWEGLENVWYSLSSWFSDAWDGLVSGVQDLLGIHSPSRVFAGIGKNMALGVGEGWEDEFGDIQNNIDKSLVFDDPSVGINASIRKVGVGAAGSAFGGTSIGNININIDGAKYSDEQSLASAIALEIQNMTDRRAAVYA